MSALLDDVAERAVGASGIAGKTDIAPVVDTLLAGVDTYDVALGDDCAAIPDPTGDGWLLLAIEGFVDSFVESMPWFAGYCGVMVNVSDVAAMGGRPTAVVDALWSRDNARAQPIAQGLAAASSKYGVPVVGGHSNTHGRQEQLSVAILGRAERLLTSFDAQPGDILVAAIDLRGAYREPLPNWDASTSADGDRLRADLEILPAVAEDGLCRAAKDISMAGVVGTALMLAECSGVGAAIDIDAVPRPVDANPARWLCEAFPSYGFVLSVAPANVDRVIARFHARDIAGAAIGAFDNSLRVRLRHGGRERLIHDFTRNRYMGCGPAATVPSG